MKSKKGEQITYSKAVTELESIVNQIEGEEIDVDVLTEKVKRASFLIKFCKTKLKCTEDEVKKLLTDLDEGTEKSNGKEGLELF
ncbi:MAG: exodeoxyribonuclease VII small subunit [Thermodesulfobacteriota bacterium]